MITGFIASLLAAGAAILGVVGLGAIVTQLIVSVVKVVTAVIVTLVNRKKKSDH